jgi:hypothetical protein
MPASDRSLVQVDLNALSQLQYSGTTIRYFGKVFGGTSPNNVVSYLGERLHYVLPPGTNIFSRVVTPGFDPNIVPQQPEPKDMGALNIGTALWFSRELLRPNSFQFKFGDKMLDVDSSRVGIVLLGSAYTADLPVILRSSVFVHEARHSDCTGGLPKSDLALLDAGQLPTQQECGHLHVECPQDHPLAGLPACDNGAWGAYMVQTLYAAAIGDNCPSCSQDDIQTARAVTVDSALRVLNFEALASGKLGDPDMSSQGVR